MHGLINRAIEVFIRETHGTPAWRRVSDVADLPREGFETMFVYPAETTERMLDAAERTLALPRDTLLEDLGTFLVTHRPWEAVRRLLRFSGDTFLEFVYSIDDLPRRARLALPELELPPLTLVGESEAGFEILCGASHPGAGHVMVGMLRTLADDYGTLVLLEHARDRDGCERVTVRILQSHHAEGRPFQLSAGS